MQHVRVYAEPEEVKNDDLWPVIVDLSIDGEKMPIGKWPALGLAYGGQDKDQLLPFLVDQKNGTVDFGEAADGDERSRAAGDLRHRRRERR